jgi:hypothetical protein
MPASSFVRGAPLAALAAAIPLVAPSVASAATAPTTSSSPEYCSTHELTPEQMAAGATSEITCYSTLEASLAAVGVAVPQGVDVNNLMATATASGQSVAAIHYKSTLGTGEYLSVAGDGCDGGGLSFAAGDSWNDTIVSTRHKLCSQIKHYSDADYGGNMQSTSGVSGILNILGGALSRQVSSIRYFGTMNQ